MQDTVYISGLESLISPDKVAAWPPAPGWIVLAGLLLLALALLLIGWIRRRRENRYRMLALKQLVEIKERAGEHAVQEDIQALNHLLKETALSIYPREQVAPLFGRAWLDFLDNHCSKTSFTDQHNNLLDSAAYLKKEKVIISEDQWNQLIAEVETWIRKHKL